MQVPHVIFIIFTIAIAVGVLIQAFVLLGMFVAFKKTAEQAREVSDKVNQHLVPALAIARNLLEDVSPKIKVATANLVETSQTVRAQAQRIDYTVKEVTDKAQAQVERVDEMATAVLDGVTQATAAVQHGIAGPLKQVAGVLNGVRAGFDVLRKKERPLHVEEDGGNFV
jgi:methyl-accepting chemotaxis protein